MKWYASVNYGLEKIVSGCLSSLGAENIKTMESAVVFEHAECFDLKCVNNVFSVITSFNSANVVNAAKSLSKRIYPWPVLPGQTFRVIIMDCGKLVSIPEPVLLSLEKNISQQTKRKPHRAKPDIEIWLNRLHTNETYYMVRTKKHASFDKTLQKGELKPDIVDIMLRLIPDNIQGVLLDPFGGSGAIANGALSFNQFNTIHTGDIDEKCVAYQKSRFSGHSKIHVDKLDARNLPFENQSIDSIVTDPPWGNFEHIDIGPLYDDFINECRRLLKSTGALVLLTSQTDKTTDLLLKSFFSFQKHDLKINGKETSLFVAKP